MRELDRHTPFKRERAACATSANAVAPATNLGPLDLSERLDAAALQKLLDDLPVLPRAVKHSTLTRLRERLVRIGAKVGTHARYVICQMAEVANPRRLFVAVLELLQRFRRTDAGVVPSG